MTRSVILGGARTPFGKLGGALASKTAVELGAAALEAALCRSGVDRTDVEHVILGQVLQGGAGQNPARQVGFKVGLDKTTTSETVNCVCGSGMRAITLADTLIRLGDHQVVGAGGMESMSNAPFLLRKARSGYRAGNGVLEDMMIGDGLTCAVAGCHMGIHGSNVAAEEGVGREDQDAWALRSHQRAIAATDSGRFTEEIIPVTIENKKGDQVIDADEGPRRDTSAEALAKLRPAFDPGGTVTAGNAPGVNDGGAAMIVADEEWARERGLPSLGRILGHGTAAWDVPYLAFTPEMAARKALDRAGLSVEDIDLVEINEAFANVALIARGRLGVDVEKVNVNGGAIALGHPLAASGARVVLTLLYELRRRGGGIGLAAICSGGGQGDALVVQVDGGR
ncbi:MAG: acetyl-CoA C-acetyltransferase [Chloroflexia bacterium]|nr:acetyl-CoA C-acetyltransferase [Chloroflexia bacterium]